MLENNARIVKNTVFLYSRTLFAVAVGLYTSRAILGALGVEDYGIYNVVGGIVMMFSFINSGMVAATQRFISFELGKNDPGGLGRVFSMSVTVHCILALIIFILAETAGLHFLNRHMNIAAGRMHAANWVYQCSILAFMLTVASVPYSACIIAHERMKAYACISILDCSLRLAAALALPYVACDKLAAYAILVFATALVVRLANSLYCRCNFPRCRFSPIRDKRLFSEMFSFAGWSFVGNLGFSAKDQGINILINLFFGASVNAARGIAYQVSAVVSSFMGNFQMAMNPQITKRYAAGEIDSMLELVSRGSKYSFFLLMVIVIPFYIRAPYVLELWLGNVPGHTVLFLRLALVMLLVDSMANPITVALQATGQIRAFQLAISFVMAMNLPVSYAVLKMGGGAHSVMYVAIATSFIGLLVRLYLLRGLVFFRLADFVKDIIMRNFAVCLLAAILPFYASQHAAGNFAGLLLVCIASLASSAMIIYFFGLGEGERSFVGKRIGNAAKRWFKT